MYAVRITDIRPPQTDAPPVDVETHEELGNAQLGALQHAERHTPHGWAVKVDEAGNNYHLRHPEGGTVDIAVIDLDAEAAEKKKAEEKAKKAKKAKKAAPKVEKPAEATLPAAPEKKTPAKKTATKASKK